MSDLSDIELVVHGWCMLLQAANVAITMLAITIRVVVVVVSLYICQAIVEVLRIVR